MTMNVKVFILVLIVGVTLWQIDAARAKSSQKKSGSRSDTSKGTSSSSGHEREHNVGQKNDKKRESSSSSEEDDKDKKNETAIDLNNSKIRLKRESIFKDEQNIKQSPKFSWIKKSIGQPKLAKIKLDPSIKRNEKSLVKSPFERNGKRLKNEKWVD